MRSIAPAVQQYPHSSVQDSSSIDADAKDTGSQGQFLLDCPICRPSVPTGDQMAMRFTKDPAQCDALGDAIADALGLCQRHAKRVAQSTQHSSAAVRLMARAVKRVQQSLRAVVAHDTLAEEILFGAPDACPVCRMDERDAARLAGRFANRIVSVPAPASPLCRPHFDALARIAAPQLRTQLLRMRRRMLGTTITILRRAIANGDSGYEAVDPSVHSALNAAVLMSVGRLPELSVVPEASGIATSNVSGVRDQSRAATEEECGCPVCAETRGATKKWLAMLPDAVRFEQDWWLVFPSCAQHVGMCLRSGAPGVAIVAAIRAAETALQQLVADARTNTAGERIAPDDGRVAGKSIVHRARRHVARIARCQGCERVAVARDRAVARLVERLESAPCRTTFERSYGLCLKHFAQAYLLAPEGAVRNMLVTIHAEKLATLGRSLEDSLQDAHAHDASGRPAEAPWRAVLYRFSGDPEGQGIV